MPGFVFDGMSRCMFDALKITVILLLGIWFSNCEAPGHSEWQKLEPGLEWAQFKSPRKAEFGNSLVTVVRFDPAYFEANVYCASQFDSVSRTVGEWAQKLGLVAAINAGMYATDHLTAVGFLKNKKHVNNPRLSKKYLSVFACQPVDEKVPPWQIIDFGCQNFADWKKKYHAFSQSIRMISCEQKNVWQQQPNKWSIAALAIDQKGRLLFIHSRSPYSVHDFIDILLQLPLFIYNAMYLEGGPEASLYFSSGGVEKELFGSFESGFFLNNSNSHPWPIPNIIGIKRKAKR